MMIELMAFASNIYGASGGAVGYPSVYSALYGLKWNEAFADAYAAVAAIPEPEGGFTGADYDAANKVFAETLARGLGWSDAEFQDFWSHSRTTMEEAMAHEEAWDAFDAFVRGFRSGGG